MITPNLRILIFDANKVYATMISDAITDHIENCSTDIAVNIHELKRRVSSTRYNLVIADIADLSDKEQISKTLAEVKTSVVWTAHDSGLMSAVGSEPSLYKPTVADIKSYIVSLLSGGGAVLVKPTNELSGIVILVIDDTIDALEVLSMALRQYGANVIGANSGQAALEVLRRVSPNVIISDIGLPDVDGRKLLPEIRKIPCCTTTPAIALTAFTDESVKLDCNVSGFNTFLCKPVEPEVLLRSILTVLGR